MLSLSLRYFKENQDQKYSIQEPSYSKVSLINFHASVYKFLQNISFEDIFIYDGEKNQSDQLKNLDTLLGEN